MTAAALTPSKEYIENGVTLAYAVPFRFRAPTHIKAQRISAVGVVTELAYGTDYSVTGGETDAGGTLTVTVAGAVGTRLRIRRETPRSQDMDYTTGDNFPAESHEAALDKAILIDQEQDQKIDDTATRALLVPDGETAASLPPATARAGKFLAFGALPSAQPVASAGTGVDAGLRTDLAQGDGAALTGYDHSEAFDYGSVGHRLKKQVFVTDAPWNGDIRACLADVGPGVHIMVPPGLYENSAGPVVLQPYQTLEIMAGATVSQADGEYENVIVNKAWAERATNGINVTGNLFWLQGEGALYRRKALIGGLSSFALQVGDFVWIDDEYQAEAQFTGSITANVLTVSAVGAGVLKVGAEIAGAGVGAARTITALGTGAGGVGTYTVSAGADVASTAMNAYLVNENAPYRGIFPVCELRGADVVVQLDRVPDANPTAAGIFRARKPDRGIRLINHGKIDYNKTGNDPATPGAPADHRRHAVVLCGVEGAVVEPGLFADTSKFCIAWGAHANCEMTGKVHGYALFSDICKIYGPSFNMTIDTVEGYPGDDLLSIHNGEPMAFSAYHITRGDIRGLRVKKLKLVYGTNGGAYHCHVYPQGRDFEIDDVVIDEIEGGTDGSALRIWDYDGGHKVGSIKIKQLNSKAQRPFWCPPPTRAYLSTTIKSLAIGLGPHVRAITGADAMTVDDRVTIDTLVIDGGAVDPRVSIGEGALLRLAATGDVKRLYVRGLKYVSSTANLFSFAAGTKLLELVSIADSDLECAAELFAASSAVFSSRPIISVQGSRLKAQKLFELGDDAALSFAGCRLEPSQYVLNVIGGIAPEVDIWADEATSKPSGQWVNGTGDAKINPKSHAIICGIEQAYIKRKAGNKATTTGLVGTIPAGAPATCDETNAANSWWAISAGAIKTY